MNQIKQIAFSADIDTLSSLFQKKERRKDIYPCEEFEAGLTSMRNLARKFDFKWTLFVVGADLLIEKNVSLLREMIKDGHEIACHSMTHPQEFRFLSRKEKIREIESFDMIVKEALGVKAIGFRAPGWNISDDTGSILLDHGYRYDSSVFPTFLAPLLKWLYRYTMREVPAKNKRTTLGQWNYMFAPTESYRSSRNKLGERGTDGVIEHPIPVTPFFRFPFYASFHLVRGYQEFRKSLGQMLKAEKTFIHYQFHLSDFVDYSKDPLKSRLPAPDAQVYVAKAFTVPLEIKMNLWEQIIKDLTTISTRKTTLAEVDINP